MKSLPTTAYRILMVAVLVFVTRNLGADPIRLENPAPTAPFTEERPEHLFFKNATVERKGKYNLDFDITLAAKIPNDRTSRIIFYVGFDIDNDANTGGTSVANPSFGQDIGFFIIKEKGESSFNASSNNIVYRGKTVDISITALKVNDDTISFKARSEIFGAYDKSKFWISSELQKFDGALSTSRLQVDALPRRGFAVLLKD